MPQQLVEKTVVSTLRFHLGTRRGGMKPNREKLLLSLESEMGKSKDLTQKVCQLFQGKIKTLEYGGKSFSPEDVFGVKWTPQPLKKEVTPRGEVNASLCVSAKNCEDCLIFVTGTKEDVRKFADSLKL